MRCKKCEQGIPRLAPILRASGYAAPRDLKCSICDTYHNSKTGEPCDRPSEDLLKEERKARLHKRKADRMNKRLARGQLKIF